VKDSARAVGARPVGLAAASALLAAMPHADTAGDGKTRDAPKSRPATPPPTTPNGLSVAATGCTDSRRPKATAVGTGVSGGVVVATAGAGCGVRHATLPVSSSVVLKYVPSLRTTTGDGARAGPGAGVGGKGAGAGAHMDVPPPPVAPAAGGTAGGAITRAGDGPPTRAADAEVGGGCDQNDAADAVGLLATTATPELPPVLLAAGVGRPVYSCQYDVPAAAMGTGTGTAAPATPTERPALPAIGAAAWPAQVCTALCVPTANALAVLASAGPDGGVSAIPIPSDAMRIGTAGEPPHAFRTATGGAVEAGGGGAGAGAETACHWGNRYEVCSGTPVIDVARLTEPGAAWWGAITVGTGAAATPATLLPPPPPPPPCHPDATVPVRCSPASESDRTVAAEGDETDAPRCIGGWTTAPAQAAGAAGAGAGGDGAGLLALVTAGVDSGEAAGGKSVGAATRSMAMRWPGMATVRGPPSNASQASRRAALVVNGTHTSAQGGCRETSVRSSITAISDTPLSGCVQLDRDPHQGRSGMALNTCCCAPPPPPLSWTDRTRARPPQLRPSRRAWTSRARWRWPIPRRGASLPLVAHDERPGKPAVVPPCAENALAVRCRGSRDWMRRCAHAWQ